MREKWLGFPQNINLNALFIIDVKFLILFCTSKVFWQMGKIIVNADGFKSQKVDPWIDSPLKLVAVSC